MEDLKSYFRGRGERKEMYSAEFVQKRGQLLSLRRELEQQRPLMSSWLKMIKSIREAAEASTKCSDEEIKALGFGLAASHVAPQVVRAFHDVQFMVDRKLGFVGELEAKLKELDKKAMARDRYYQKMNSHAERLVRKRRAFASDDVKYAREFEDARFEFELLYCEVASELDFILIESRRGAVRQELNFLKKFAALAFQTDGQHQSAVMLTEEATRLENYMNDFRVRRSTYIEERKMGMLKKASLPSGMISLDKFRGTGSSSPGSSIMSYDDELKLRAMGSSAAQKRLGIKFESTKGSENEQAAGISSQASTPRTCASSLTNTASSTSLGLISKQLSSASSESPEDAEDDEEREERGYNVEMPYTENESYNSEDFLIMDSEDWQQFVDRQTGEEYWIEKATGLRHTEAFM